MRILTWARTEEPHAHAITQEQWDAGEHLPDNWDDFVWQDQPTVEAAIARHDHAVDLWHDDVEKNGDQTQDTY